MDDYSYFEDFPNYWLYDRADELYTLNEFENLQALKSFHDKYTPSDEIIE